MPTATTEEEEFYHEHELPRKRHRGYDDITSPSIEGGEEE